MPSLTTEELHGKRPLWLYAIDVLIETQGEVCLLPLPCDAAERLFPSVRFRVRERSRHKSALVMQKYSRQQAREAEQKARAYQALVAQAEIELAFHSPETVGSWHARWSDRVGGDNISNLLSPDLTIASPFVITMVMEAEDQVATQGEATRKYLDRDKKAKSPYATLFPGVAKQAQEWKDIRERLNSNQTCIVRYYYNITTFCPDTDEDALVCEQQVINTFKKNGIELFSPTYMQFRNWIAMIPFIHAEGLWEDIKMGGATCRAESIQAVNLLPVVADKGISS